MDTFKNFAKVTVSTGYDASATSIVLSGGHGAKLPTPPFNATWYNSTDYPDPSDDPNVEIVRVTAIATDTLTVTRAQESTSASTKNTASKTYKMVAGLTAKTLNTDLITTSSDAYNAKEHGLIGDGVTDDTEALQALIDVVAADGGGRIYFPAGCYLIGGPFQARTNSQIALPECPETDPFVIIHLVGTLPTANCFWYHSTTPPTGAPFSVIKSTRMDGNETNALFKASMGPGTIFYNNLSMRYTNLVFALPPNPTYTAIDMRPDIGGWIDDCLIYAGTIELDMLAEPTWYWSYGLKLPGANHSGGTEIKGLAVTGFYNGVLDGEVGAMDNVHITGCRRALIELGAPYPGVHGHMQFSFCPYGIVGVGGIHRELTIRLLVIEDAGTSGALWQGRINHCEDTDNILYGDVTWVREVGGELYKNGGENLVFRRLGALGSLPLTYGAGEIGFVSNTTVVVSFSEPVKASSYVAGVTIKVNGVPATISSGTRQMDKSVVRYILSAPVSDIATVEFLYAAIDGFIESEKGIQLPDVAEIVTNNIAGGAFNPSHVAGLALWLAADSLALADNDPVATWSDLGAAANHATQATPLNRPIFKTAQLNSLPIVRFDGTNGWLGLASQMASQIFTYFAVIKHTLTASQGILIGHDNSGISWDFAGAGDNKPRLVKASVAVVGQATTDIGSSYAIIAVSYATPEVAFYLNGAADGTAMNAQTFVDGPGNAVIGAQWAGGDTTLRFGGDIAEIVCYDNVISGSDRAMIFDYLNTKYAVY